MKAWYSNKELESMTLRELENERLAVMDSESIDPKTVRETVEHIAHINALLGAKQSRIEFESWFDPKRDIYCFRVSHWHGDGKRGVILAISGEKLERLMETVPEGGEYPQYSVPVDEYPGQSGPAPKGDLYDEVIGK